MSWRLCGLLCVESTRGISPWEVATNSVVLCWHIKCMAFRQRSQDSIFTIQDFNINVSIVTNPQIKSVNSFYHGLSLTFSVTSQQGQLALHFTGCYIKRRCFSTEQASRTTKSEVWLVLGSFNLLMAREPLLKGERWTYWRTLMKCILLTSND